MLPVMKVKLLKMIMNSKLRYRTYMALAVIKELKIIMTLKRLQMISSSMTRQLFICMMTLVMNYVMIV